MKKIELTQGKYTIIDDVDFDFLTRWRWKISKNFHNDGYAVRNFYDRNKKKLSTISMHRQIMNPSKDMEVDHINGDGLDNRRENLRVCTRAENSRNHRINKNNTSGAKGVRFRKDTGKWESRICINRKLITIGNFENVKDAILAYNDSAKKYFGDFAKLNISANI